MEGRDGMETGVSGRLVEIPILLLSSLLFRIFMGQGRMVFQHYRITCLF